MNQKVPAMQISSRNFLKSFDRALASENIFFSDSASKTETRRVVKPTLDDKIFHDGALNHTERNAHRSFL